MTIVISEQRSVMESMSSFGLRLRTVRETLGYGQSDFAHILGTSASAISLYESGNRRPKLDFMLKLRGKFHLNINGLLDALNEADRNGAA